MYIMKLPVLTVETALDGPYAIILAPTRELAQQIHDECQKFGSYTNTRAQAIVGGVCCVCNFEEGCVILCYV